MKWFKLEPTRMLLYTTLAKYCFNNLWQLFMNTTKIYFAKFCQVSQTFRFCKLRQNLLFRVFKILAFETETIWEAIKMQLSSWNHYKMYTHKSSDSQNGFFNILLWFSLSSSLFLSRLPLSFPFPLFFALCPWSSLAEGDEQLDRPNSQTCMECCRTCAA